MFVHRRSLRAFVCSILVLYVATIAAAGITAELELINPLAQTVEFGIGSRANPPVRAYRTGRLKLTPLKPGGRQVITLSGQEFSRILVRSANQPLASVYEFQSKPGQRISIQLMANNGVIEARSSEGSFKKVGAENLLRKPGTTAGAPKKKAVVTTTYDATAYGVTTPKAQPGMATTTYRNPMPAAAESTGDLLEDIKKGTTLRKATPLERQKIKAEEQETLERAIDQRKAAIGAVKSRENVSPVAEEEWEE